MEKQRNLGIKQFWATLQQIDNAVTKDFESI